MIGAALNSVASLFNNSCDVNTVKYHRGRHTVMLARYTVMLARHTVMLARFTKLKSYAGQTQTSWPPQLVPHSSVMMPGLLHPPESAITGEISRQGRK